VSPLPVAPEDLPGRWDSLSLTTPTYPLTLSGHHPGHWNSSCWVDLELTLEPALSHLDCP